jgi:WD40 repeat protein
VVFSPDGRWLAASGGSKKEGVIRLWDAQTGTEHAPIRTRTGRVGSIAFSPDSQRLVAASWDHTLKLFDPQTGQDVLTLRGHTDGVTGVVFSADGWRIASTSRDKTVRLWNATPVGHR